MAYMKTTLISSPVESSYSGVSGVQEALGVGVKEALGLDWGAVSSAGSSVLNFFGQGLKAQGAQEALAEQMKAQAAAQAAAQAGRSEGIPTTYLLIGGLALAGVLVFAMRRK